MNITPDQADRFEQEATGGWWGIEQHGPEYFPQVFAYRREDGLLLRTPITDNGIVEDGDARIIAAAPDLAHTIAGMTWQWGARDAYGNMLPIDPDNRWDDEQDAPVWEVWTEVEPCLGRLREKYEGVHIVRRLVGPAEPIDEETPND